MLKKIILIISLLFAGIVFMFWWVLHDRSKDISKFEPFSEIMDKTVTLQRDVVLVKNDVGNGRLYNIPCYTIANESMYKNSFFI